jgi:predicted nucleic acid-binding protein
MSERVIADSSFLVALFDQSDLLHAKALALGNRGDLEAVFLDCVMNEVFTVVGRRAGERNRIKDLPALFDGIRKTIPPDRIVWVYPEVRGRYGEILSLMRAHGGALNFHDCLIALSARAMGIERIASFDADFDKVGWMKRVS